jgi:DNA repair ATPase RecN
MDQELIAYLDERFGETSRQIQGLREETAQQFATARVETAQQFAASREETAQRFERLEEKVRHNGVEIEGLRGEIRQVADGVAVANEKLEDFEKRFTTKLMDVQTETQGLVRMAFEEIRALKTKGSGKDQEGPAPTT